MYLNVKPSSRKLALHKNTPVSKLPLNQMDGQLIDNITSLRLVAD